MFKLRNLMLLLGLVFLIGFTRNAHAAGCYGYRDSDEICFSQTCSGEYTKSYCSLGCTHGTCVAQGGSGLCCGHIYYNAEIYPDGENGCGDCGNVRVHQSLSAADLNPHSRELWRGAVFKKVVLSDAVVYRPSRLLFVPDRCGHQFGLLVEPSLFSASGGL